MTSHCHLRDDFAGLAAAAGDLQTWKCPFHRNSLNLTGWPIATRCSPCLRWNRCCSMKPPRTEAPHGSLWKHFYHCGNFRRFRHRCWSSAAGSQSSTGAPSDHYS
uniref:(northern house mosquito) hypothetical protein n=1 Tax=Culex pipiens TaxID=7175 RepID=A0A8D8ATA4_CULPI